MLDIGIKKLDNGNVLVSERKEKSNKPAKYYILKEENADKFIRGQKSLEGANTIQNVASIGLALCSGAYVLSKINSNIVVKYLAGISTAFGVLGGCQQLDAKISKKSQESTLKKLGVEDVTYNEAKLNRALNYQK
jgi:hypothetical protein